MNFSDNSAVFRLVMAQNQNVDPATALLSGMDGAAGLIGFDRFANDLNEAQSERDKARGEAGRMTEVVDTGARKFLKLDSGAQVTPAQRDEFRNAIMATGDDAPKVIIGKGDAAPEPAADPGANETINTLVKELKGLVDETADMTNMTAFASALHGVYREVFNPDAGETFDEAAVAWAQKAATFLRDVQAAHAAASSEQKDAMVWAKARLTSPTEPG